MSGLRRGHKVPELPLARTVVGTDASPFRRASVAAANRATALDRSDVSVRSFFEGAEREEKTEHFRAVCDRDAPATASLNPGGVGLELWRRPFPDGHVVATTPVPLAFPNLPVVLAEIARVLARFQRCGADVLPLAIGNVEPRCESTCIAFSESPKLWGRAWRWLLR